MAETTRTRWFIRALTVAAFGLTVSAAAIPSALATSTGHLCIVTDTDCVHRTTVVADTVVKLKGVYNLDRDVAPRWGLTHTGHVLMREAGSATGFVRVARVVKYGPPYHPWMKRMGHLDEPGTYAFRFETKRGLTDRAIVHVTAP
jgi:hypothetical protein